MMQNICWQQVFSGQTFISQMCFIASPHLSFPCCSWVTQYLPSGFIPTSNVGKISAIILQTWFHKYLRHCVKPNMKLRLACYTCANWKQRQLTHSRRKTTAIVELKFHMENQKGDGIISQLLAWIGQGLQQCLFMHNYRKSSVRRICRDHI